MFLDKTKADNHSISMEYSILGVTYKLPFYFPNIEGLPERKGGTGIADWKELTDLQKQLVTTLHPDISNAVYKQQQALEQATKLDNIIKLARGLSDDDILMQTMEILGYDK